MVEIKNRIYKPVGATSGEEKVFERWGGLGKGRRGNRRRKGAISVKPSHLVNVHMGVSGKSGAQSSFMVQGHMLA